MYIFTSLILFASLPAILASASPEEAMKEEDAELRNKYFITQFEKMEARIEKVEELLEEYYLKTEAFSGVYKQLDAQKIPIKAMKQTIVYPDDPGFTRFKADRSLADDEAQVEYFQEEIPKLMKAVFSTEKLLSDLEHWGNFSTIYKVMNEQIRDIRQLERVNVNIIGVPQVSVLAQTMERNDSITLVKPSAAKVVDNGRLSGKNLRKSSLLFR